MKNSLKHDEKKLCCGHAHGIIVVTLRMLPLDFVVTLQLNPMIISGEEIGECLSFSYRGGVWVEIHFKWHFMLFYNDNGLFLDIKIPLLIYNEPSLMENYLPILAASIHLL